MVDGGGGGGGGDGNDDAPMTSKGEWCRPGRLADNYLDMFACQFTIDIAR